MSKGEDYKTYIQEMLEETEDTEILCFVYTVFKNLLE